MDAMEDYLWLFAVAGGALLLGAVLAYGVLRQRPLSVSEQDRQDKRVRSLYGDENPSGQSRSVDGSDRPRARTAPLILAMIFVVASCALGYYVATQPGAPSPSVEGKEDPNTQPAGPADEKALPGQQ